MKGALGSACPKQGLSGLERAAKAPGTDPVGRDGEADAQPESCPGEHLPPRPLHLLSTERVALSGTR